MDFTIMKFTCTFVFLLCVFQTGFTDDCFYPTRHDYSWSRECRQGQTVSQLTSIFQDSYKDRSWRLCCRQIPDVQSAASNLNCGDWSAYNPFREYTNFHCPEGSFINSISSRHDDNDRQFRFRCCMHEEVIPTHCQTDTDWANSFTKKLNYVVEEDRVLVGVQSYYSNNYEDRVFAFTTCTMD